MNPPTFSSVPCSSEAAIFLISTSIAPWTRTGRTASRGAHAVSAAAAKAAKSDDARLVFTPAKA